ncbi:hypothetical protein FJZ36_15590 [Candidatus Poribacteria bacterium]|nr:hypothetical protein [Candidatus Poribacteria bacterium]
MQTFGELIASISGQASISGTIGENRFKLSKLVPVEGCRPWDPEDLYDEFYAYAVGRALPLSFRGFDPYLRVAEPDNYRDVRSRVIGEEAAEEAAKILRILLERETDWASVFPQPVAAQQAIARLRDGLPPTTPPFGGLFVDEIQDLTPVEYYVVIRLLQCIKEQKGTTPDLVVAGDEAQVVVPSGFDWGEFNEMASAQLGAKPEKYNLDHNVRSPGAIAQVINNTWGLYRSFDKGARPQGRARAADEYHATANVISTHCESDDELRSVLDAVRHKPDSMVVYPGASVPQDLADNAAMVSVPEQIKGLECRAVVVIDSGNHLVRVKKKAGSASDDGLHAHLGKLDIDRLRVALSRSTETLILLERSPNIDRKKEIQRLIDGVPNVLHFAPDEVLAFVRHEDADPGELLLQFIGSINALLDNDRVVDAHRQADIALTLAKSPGEPGAVEDASIRRELCEVVATTFFRAAFDERNEQGIPSQELLNDAAEHFTSADQSGTAEAIRCVHPASDRCLAHLERAQHLRALIDRLPRVDPRVATLLHQTAWDGLTSILDAEASSPSTALGDVLEVAFLAIKSGLSRLHDQDQLGSALVSIVGSSVAQAVLEQVIEEREVESRIARRYEERLHRVRQDAEDAQKRQIEHLQQQIQRLDQRAKELAQERDDARSSKENLTQQLHRAKQRADQAEDDALGIVQDRIQTDARTIEHLQQQIQRLDQGAKELAQERDDALRIAEDRIQTDARTYAGLVRREKKRADQAEKRADNLDQDIKALEARARDLEHERSEALRRAQHREDQIQQLEDQIQQLQDRLSRLGIDEAMRGKVHSPPLSVHHSPHLGVPAGVWYPFDFVVTSDMADPFLCLAFNVTSGTDVEVFVFHESEYASWSDVTSPGGPNAEPVYFSGRVVSVSRDIKLTRPGRYYLVVSNRFSVFTDKVMKLDADLEYQL